MRAKLILVTSGRQDEIEATIDPEALKASVWQEEGYWKNSSEAMYILKELAPGLVQVMHNIEINRIEKGE